jgi:hypothetical protein
MLAIGSYLTSSYLTGLPVLMRARPSSHHRKLSHTGSLRCREVFERQDASLEVRIGAAAPLGHRQQGDAYQFLDVVETIHRLNHPTTHEAEQGQDSERLLREMDSIDVRALDRRRQTEEAIALRLIAGRELAEGADTLR